MWLVYCVELFIGISIGATLAGLMAAGITHINLQTDIGLALVLVMIGGWVVWSWSK